jgi:hypothetical protein
MTNEHTYKFIVLCGKVVAQRPGSKVRQPGSPLPFYYIIHLLLKQEFKKLKQDY